MLCKSKPLFYTSLAIFVLVESVFFVLIQMGISGIHNNLCFTSVIVAFAFSVLIATPRVDSLITVLGLLFTVCADYCLLLIYPEPRIIAMSFFNTVQACYFIRILLNSGSRREVVVHVAVRLAIVISAVVVAFVILGGNPDIVSLISMIYFANLATNIVFAFYHHDRYLLFAIGLLSFAFCDIFVGLGVLVNDYLHLGRDNILWQLTHSRVNFIWLFYVPSQTLISISAAKKQKTT